jgi:hypothetical protein
MVFLCIQNTPRDDDGLGDQALKDEKSIITNWVSTICSVFFRGQFSHFSPEKKRKNKNRFHHMPEDFCEKNGPNLQD